MLKSSNIDQHQIRRIRNTYLTLFSRRDFTHLPLTGNLALPAKFSHIIPVTKSLLLLSIHTRCLDYSGGDCSGAADKWSTWCKCLWSKKGHETQVSIVWCSNRHSDWCSLQGILYPNKYYCSIYQNLPSMHTCNSSTISSMTSSHASFAAPRRRNPRARENEYITNVHINRYLT